MSSSVPHKETLPYQINVCKNMVSCARYGKYLYSQALTHMQSYAFCLPLYLVDKGFVPIALVYFLILFSSSAKFNLEKSRKRSVRAERLKDRRIVIKMYHGQKLLKAKIGSLFQQTVRDNIT